MAVGVEEILGVGDGAHVRWWCGEGEGDGVVLIMVVVVVGGGVNVAGASSVCVCECCFFVLWGLEV